jgi:ABC-2 type transport system ATP-binding protein
MVYAVEAFKLTKVFRRHRSFSKLILHPFRKPEEVLAVDNISLKIRKGEALCLLGPNGAGKTTIIKIFASLILPTSGKISVNASVGLVTGEDRSFYWRLTGRQNLEFFAALYGLSPREAKKRIKTLTDQLTISKLLDVTFQEYSAGIKQRLSIARSLLGDPEILLFDEPTKSLDPSYAQGVRDFIKKELIRQRQKTIVFTAHNFEEASYLTDQLVLMENGRIRLY